MTSPPRGHDNNKRRIKGEIHKASDSGTLQLLERLTVSKRLAAEWAGLSAAGFVTSLFLFGGLYTSLVGQSNSFTVRIDPGNIQGLIGPGLLSLALIFGVIVVHELIHGAAMKRYGGDPEYGYGVAQFVLPYAYATSDESFTRNQFIVIALAPLVLLTGVLFSIAVYFQWSLLLLPLALNVGGAIGDLWMTRLLLRYPDTIYVVDKTTELEIYGDDSVSPRTTPAQSVLRKSITGFGMAIGIGFIAVMLTPIVLEIAGVTSLSVGPSDSMWSIYQFEQTEQGVGSEIGFAGILGCSALFGLSYAVLSSGDKE